MPRAAALVTVVMKGGFLSEERTNALRVVVLNSESSTLKFVLDEIPPSREKTSSRHGESSLRGLVDRIGGATTRTLQADRMRQAPQNRQILDHRQAIQWVLERLGGAGVDAVGHRVVHGGERFTKAVRIDATVMAEIEQLSELAPLHNPACLAGINAARAALGYDMPMEGLVMGTRCGDLDPVIVGYLSRRERMSVEQVEQWLNERSGLLGLSALSHDVRDLLAAEQQGDTRAAVAVDVFCYRVRKYIGSYLAALGGADAVLFGGGIGEYSPEIRARVCDGMDWCGLVLDRERNEKAVGLPAGRAARISRDGANVEAYVVAADEETWIARETLRCLCGANHHRDTPKPGKGST